MAEREGMSDTFSVFKNGIYTINGSGTTPGTVTGVAGVAINNNFITLANALSVTPTLQEVTDSGAITTDTVTVGELQTNHITDNGSGTLAVASTMSANVILLSNLYVSGNIGNFGLGVTVNDYLNINGSLSVNGLAGIDTGGNGAFTTVNAPGGLFGFSGGYNIYTSNNAYIASTLNATYVNINGSISVGSPAAGGASQNPVVDTGSNGSAGNGTLASSPSIVQGPNNLQAMQGDGTNNPYFTSAIALNALPYTLFARIRTTAGGSSFMSILNLVPVANDLVLCLSNGFLYFNSYGNLQGPVAINDGFWHDVAVTVDSDGNATMFQDGVPVGTMTAASLLPSGTPSVPNNMLTVGWESFDRGYPFIGEIADVRIYNYNLSSSSIAYLTNPNGNTAPPLGPVDAYNFSEQSSPPPSPLIITSEGNITAQSLNFNSGGTAFLPTINSTVTVGASVGQIGYDSNTSLAYYFNFG